VRPVDLLVGGWYLVCDIWPSVTDVSAHLSHHSNVLVAVQEREFFIFPTRFASVGGLVGFETRVREDDDQPLGVLVVRRDRDVLVSNHLWQFWGW